MALWNGNDALNSNRHYTKGFHDAICVFSTLFRMLPPGVSIGQTLNPYFSGVSNEFQGGFTVTEIKNIISGLNVSVEEAALPYLIAHEKLFKMVCDARTKLNEYFEPELTQYCLSRTYDPETQSEGLMLEIHTDQRFTEAMACLEKFENDWWLDNMPTNGEKFIIDVVFA